MEQGASECARQRSEGQTGPAVGREGDVVLGLQAALTKGCASGASAS